MNKIIKTHLPQNYLELPTAIQKYFKPNYSYNAQYVQLLRNCYITPKGIVISNLKYIKGCCYSPVVYKKRYYLNALKQILFSFITQWGRQNKEILPDTVCYSLIHQPYINYYHWIFESLTRLIILDNANIDNTLIIPENLKNIEYIKDTLNLLGVRNYKIVGTDKLVFAKKLALPEIVRWGGHHDPEILLKLRTRLLNAFSGCNFTNDSPERLFVKRNGRRKIANFNDIENILEKYDFKVLDFEGMSVYQQIGIMQGVKIFIAQCGAALTNMMFMPFGGKVVEIHNNPEKLNYPHLDDEYFNASTCFMHDYYAIISEPVGEHKDFFSTDCTININDFEKMILEIISKSKA